MPDTATYGRKNPRAQHARARDVTGPGSQPSRTVWLLGRSIVAAGRLLALPGRTVEAAGESVLDLVGWWR